MTQVWQGEKIIAVTKVLAGPCPVVQLKNQEPDGYSAVQLGFGLRKEKNIKKPQIGHLKKAGLTAIDGNKNLRYLREFRVIPLRGSRATNAAHANKIPEGIKDLKVGNVIDVSTFQAGDTVKVTGTSKGKGFQGGVKRHHFHGHNTTHGTKDQVRTSGAIGAGGPQHVFKGKRMPGRMGDARITTSNLMIVQVDQANNILYISGSVPGARNGLVMIYGDGELKVVQPNVEKAEVKEAKPAVEVVAEKPVEAVKAAEPVKEEKSAQGESASGGKEANKTSK